METSSRRHGFSILELLIVIAIIGILAAMAIVNYWLGLERARQKRTMSDMRTLAVAFEQRATEVRGYNAAGWTVPATPLTTAEVGGLLSPTYMKNPPTRDGWNRALEFSLDQPVGGTGATIYAIRSAGSDGVFEGSTYTPGTTQKFDCDIVYSNGSFISYPASR